MQSKFAQKLLNGIKPEPEEWEENLRDYHKRSPSTTPLGFADYKTSAGINSYEVLADEIPSGEFEVLDLACGDGYLFNFLPAKSRVTGIDMSEGELAVARKKFSNESRVKFVSGRAQELPFPNESFDFVICHMAFMLMVPLQPVADEIKRVIKPGGVFAAVTENKEACDPSYLPIRNIFGEFFERKFPHRLKIPASFDPLVATLAGWKELFAGEEVEMEEFTIDTHYNREEFWLMHKYTYFVDMLSEADQNELRELLDKYFVANSQENRVSYKFAMRKWIVRKHAR